ncbi:hypothetical protein AB0L41_25770 [Amycolatopsis mediterranei]
MSMSRRTRKQLVGKAAENYDIRVRIRTVHMLRRELRRQWLASLSAS